MLHGNNGLENKLEVDPFAGMMSDKKKNKQSENIGIYDIHTEKISEFEWDIYLEAKNEKKLLPPIKILSINEKIDSLTMYPFISFKNHHSFLEKKDYISAITLDGFGVTLSDNVEELNHLVSLLPKGIYNKLDYGYGIDKKYHHIIHHLPYSDLVISQNSKTQIKEDRYILNYNDYEKLRKAIDRITENHQKEAKEEKKILVHNTLLHQIDSKKYSEQYKKYKKDTLYNIMINQIKSNNSISDKDKKAVINMVKNNTQEIYKTDKSEILELVENIKLINLEDLILKIKEKINTNKEEAYWQKLFNDNPFILSLAFSFPIIKIGEQISVGGRGISGTGDKITDFLVKNKSTDNVAIIEIKKPSSTLMQSRYRDGVYPPMTRELVGSVNQVLDQKFHFQQEFVQLMYNQNIYNTKNYYINCLLIIGKTPETDEQKKSFELFRNNSKDVNIVTFDELLSKLENLYEFLSKEKE